MQERAALVQQRVVERLLEVNVHRGHERRELRIGHRGGGGVVR